MISTHIERWVTIIVVILDNASNRMDSHLVLTQLLFNASFVAEAMSKNIEVLEPPIKSFLTILCSGYKRLDIRWVLIFFYH